MCGLIGVISNEPAGLFAVDADIFSSMLVINSLRGPHSTGAFGVNLRDNETEWAKSIGSPYMAFNTDPFKKLMDRIPSKYRAIIGHGRFATRGAVNDENAHPFEVGNITLVHNGTLVNGYKLENFHTFPVDSQFFTWYINEHGIDKAYRDIEGAIATIFYDKSTDQLQAIRNSERPLFLIEGEKKTLLSSEEATLLWIKHKFPNEKFKEPKYLQEHRLYTFNTRDVEWDSRELTPYKPVSVMSHLRERYLPNPDNSNRENESNIIHIQKRRDKNIKSIKIQGKQFKIDDEINVIVDDVVPIYNGRQQLKRIVVHATAELDLDSSVADFVLSVNPDQHKEEDFYNCDYMRVKIDAIYRKKDVNKLSVSASLVGICFRTEMEEIITSKPKLCQECNNILIEGEIVNTVINGENAYVCKSCGTMQ